MNRYRVSGAHAIDGHQPDDVFETSFSEEHELYLLQGGHLELVQADPSVDGNADEADVEAGDPTQRPSRNSASRKEQD